MTIRQLFQSLVGLIVNCDDGAFVRILHRDEFNVVTKVARVPVRRISNSCDICIEASEIKWEEAN